MTAPAGSRPPESGEDVFEQHRDRLFGIGYRMTGSVADAEDLCQEAWLRWQRTDRGDVRDPEAFLVRTTTRLAIDRLRSAQHRREQYVGPWLPEPIVTGAMLDSRPEEAAEMADSLTFAFLVMLDRLTPTERAVFLLREVFSYGYDEIAASTGRTTEACRQIVSRTRRKLADDRVELAPVSSEEEQQVIGELVLAMFSGDVDKVVHLLSPDVVLISDGGADHRAGRHPIVSAPRVARLMVNLAKRTEPDATFEFVRVNGAPGILSRVGDEPVMEFHAEFGPDGLIRRLFGVLNPDKLAHLR